MTAELIAEARALADAATAGPWTVVENDYEVRVIVDEGKPLGPHGLPSDWVEIAEMGQIDAGPCPDAAFVARARALVPELADALAAERALADQLAAIVSPYGRDAAPPAADHYTRVAEAVEAWRIARGTL